MPFVPTVNTLKADLHYDFAGQQCSNTLYFTGSASPDEALAIDLGEALAAWWVAEYAPGISEQVQLVEVVITDIGTEDGFSLAVVPGTSAVGENVTPPLPHNCALCVSFRTGHRGRSARGRNYVLGICENQTAGSLVDAGVELFFQEAYAELIGAGTVVPGLQWVVVSTISNGAPRSAGLAQPITSVLTVDRVIDSQRRRLPGRGR